MEAIRRHFPAWAWIRRRRRGSLPGNGKAGTWSGSSSWGVRNA